jgi:hypothetical protein
LKSLPLRTGAHSSCQNSADAVPYVFNYRLWMHFLSNQKVGEEGFGQEIWEKISKMVQQGWKEMKEEIEQK